MIKCSKFTDNIGSPNFIDTFCPKDNKFQKRVFMCWGGGGEGEREGRGTTPPHPLLEILLAAHSIFNLKYRELEKNSKIFYNRTNYDYHFIVKELAEEFERQFTSLNNMKCAIAKIFKRSMHKNLKVNASKCHFFLTTCFN